MRNCRSNYSNCLETCDPSKPYMYNSQCNAPADLPPGVGADPSTFEVKACAIPNCTRCQEDYLQCQGCNSTPLPAYYLYNGGCYLPASLPTGIGANFSSGLTGPCIDSNCKECKYDLTKCSQCHGPTDPQYFLDTTQQSVHSLLKYPSRIWSELSKLHDDTLQRNRLFILPEQLHPMHFLQKSLSQPAEISLWRQLILTSRAPTRCQSHTDYI
jgi:hypothetical protein